MITLLAIVTKDPRTFWPFVRTLHASILKHLAPCVGVEWFVVVDFVNGTTLIEFELPGTSVSLIDRERVTAMPEFHSLVKQCFCRDHPCAEFLIKLFLDLVMPQVWSEGLRQRDEGYTLAMEYPSHSHVQTCMSYNPR